MLTLSPSLQLQVPPKSIQVQALGPAQNRRAVEALGVINSLMARIRKLKDRKGQSPQVLWVVGDRARAQVTVPASQDMSGRCQHSLLVAPQHLCEVSGTGRWPRFPRRGESVHSSESGLLSPTWVAGLLRRVLKDRADIDLGSRPALPQPFWGSSVPFCISGSRLPQGHESEVDSLFMVAANYKGLSLMKRKVAFSFARL